MVFVIHWHESAMDLHVFPIPIPPPTSLSTRSLWVFPVHQAGGFVSCIQPGLMICFTQTPLIWTVFSFVLRKAAVLLSWSKTNHSIILQLKNKRIIQQTTKHTMKRGILALPSTNYTLMLPDLRFCIPLFQLPVFNHGLNIFKGNF